MSTIEHKQEGLTGVSGTSSTVLQELTKIPNSLIIELGEKIVQGDDKQIQGERDIGSDDARNKILRDMIGKITNDNYFFLFFDSNRIVLSRKNDKAPIGEIFLSKIEIPCDTRNKLILMDIEKNINEYIKHIKLGANSIEEGHELSLVKKVDINDLRNYDCKDDIDLLTNGKVSKSTINGMNALIRNFNSNYFLWPGFNINTSDLYVTVEYRDGKLEYTVRNGIFNDDGTINPTYIDAFKKDSLPIGKMTEIRTLLYNVIMSNENKKHFPLFHDLPLIYYNDLGLQRINFRSKGLSFDSSYSHGGTSNINYEINHYGSFGNVARIGFEKDYLKNNYNDIISKGLTFFGNKLGKIFSLSVENKDKLSGFMKNDYENTLTLIINDSIDIIINRKSYNYEIIYKIR